MRVRTCRRTAALSAATVLAGIALASGPAEAFGAGGLRAQVDSVQRTGTVGVLAEAAGRHEREHATAGLSDTAVGTPAETGDRFRIGSATKTFTATVLLQLVGEGQLTLDDAVERWLPGVVDGNGNDGSRITVRQLLQHTSGLFNYTSDFPEMDTKENFLAQRYTTWTSRQLVAIAMRHAPDFAPGTRWEYSNTNYILAGMIIERITGRSWQDEVEQRIIAPLGLHRTLAPGTSPRVPGPHMHGYSNFGSGEAIDATVFNPTAAGAAGAVVSTTGDLVRFWSALLGGRLLRPDQLAEMQSTVPAPALAEEWPGARYGLGVMWIPLTCGGGYWGHGGDMPGYTTRDGSTPDGHRTVVVAVSGDGAPDGLATERAMDRLIDHQLCAPTAPDSGTS
ncbi:serine hydrolase domain-containing protein [Streptomyces sp. NPDC048504]|uniref:serine hydrolase domain-containing protein n=1 Tax=Streptomyces sp. NPDC048504 TaxID=3365559 RepID=UPI00372304DD